MTKYTPEEARLRLKPYKSSDGEIIAIIAFVVACFTAAMYFLIVTH